MTIIWQSQGLVVVVEVYPAVVWANRNHFQSLKESEIPGSNPIFSVRPYLGNWR